MILKIIINFFIYTTIYEIIKIMFVIKKVVYIAYAYFYLESESYKYLIYFTIE